MGFGNTDVKTEEQKAKHLLKHAEILINRFIYTINTTNIDLTFVDDREDGFSIAAVHIGTVAHLADVGSVEGWKHLFQGDGGVFPQDVSWPLCMAFETPFLRMEWFPLVVKYLQRTNKQKQMEKHK